MLAAATALMLRRTVSSAVRISPCFTDAPAIGGMQFPHTIGAWAISIAGSERAASPEKLVAAVAVYSRRVLRDSGVCRTENCQLVRVDKNGRRFTEVGGQCATESSRPARHGTERSSTTEPGP